MTPLAPWLIVIPALITIYGLLRVARLSNSWRMYVLIFIPLAFFVVYTWIWFYAPHLERVSWVVRQIIFFSFGVADFVIFDFLGRAGNFNRRHNDR